MTGPDPTARDDDVFASIPTWVLLVAAIALTVGGLLLLTVGLLADVGVPLLVLGLFVLWESIRRWRRKPDQSTHWSMLNTVIVMLVLAAVALVAATAVPGATDAANLGVILLLVALAFALYDGWTWRKELQSLNAAKASGPGAELLKRQKRTALTMITVLAAVGVVTVITVLLLSPGLLYLLGIALPLAATAVVLAFKLRSRDGPGQPPW